MSIRSVIAAFGACVLAACAAQPESTSANTKVAMSSGPSCASKLDAEKAQCEQTCPTPTGKEHFSVQHKIARENLECKEQCAATHADHAKQCK